MIRILTDSASDITPAQAKAMGVELVTLNIRFPGQAYDPLADEDFSEFYRLLTTQKAFPTTSQPAPEAFARVFAEAKAAGDSVVAVLISGGLSGTIQSAQVARETVGHAHVHIIDSRAAIMPQRILVEYAVRLREAGEPLDSLIAKVSAVRDRVRVYGMLDTLTYLYKGGRLSRTVALAGNLLHIRPVITARDGVIAMVGRGRNDRTLLNYLEADGFDPDFPVYFGYTATEANCLRLIQHAKESFTFPQTGMFPIGGLVGAHVGPNGFALAYVPKG